MKTEEHNVSRYFQHFLDSAAIELDVFNELYLQPRIFVLQLFMWQCSWSSTAIKTFQSSWLHYEVEQIANVKKSDSSADIPEVQ